MGRTAEETTARTVAGAFDFAYTNHLFTPERVKLGYTVIARMDRPAIQGQIVTREGAPYRDLAELAGLKVVFPSREAFVGYQVPMAELRRRGIQVEAIFGNNQEGAMARLFADPAVAAAGVNASLMRAYAQREGVGYRALWTSEPFADLALMAHPRVPKAGVEAVRDALIHMADDAEGRRILARARAILPDLGPRGFIAATDADYESYRRFYRASR